MLFATFRIATNRKMKSLGIKTFMVLSVLKAISCDLLVYPQSTNTIMEEFPDALARFGPLIPSIGFKCLAVAGSPENGCTPIKPPPNVNVSFRWCVVLARYNCSFEAKVRIAQAALYDAVIIHNVGSDELEAMSATNDNGISIPAIFIGEHSGRTLIADYQYNENFALLINNDSPFNINTHLLIPFTIVVGLCFVTMVIFTLVRCCRERRRIMRYRLPKSVLKKIPVIKFARGVHHYETCAICLDDYFDGEKLRILPCGHGYHCRCIDPWLTKNRRVCPMCKRKVFVRGEKRPPRRHSASDNSTASDVDDNTPLLTANDQLQPDHGTFPQHDNEPFESQSTGLIEGNTALSSNLDGISDDDDILEASTNNILSNERLTSWQKFKSMCDRFRNRVNFLSVDANEDQSPLIDHQARVPTTSINMNPSIFSNNVLNSNLSGSFQRENNDVSFSDEENILIARQNQSSIEEIAASSSSIRVHPSPSLTGRIGLAVIPNTRFNHLPQSARGNADLV